MPLYCSLPYRLQVRSWFLSFSRAVVLCVPQQSPACSFNSVCCDFCNYLPAVFVQSAVTSAALVAVPGSQSYAHVDLLRASV